MTNGDTCPRLYVACLASYNAGHLYGRWIDAAQPVESVQSEIQDMLRHSPEPGAEEWAIHDYEGFGSLSLSEFECIEAVAEAARLIAEHGPVFAALVEHFGGVSNLQEARDKFEDGYRGAYGSVADYAQELVEECYGPELERLPQFIRYHIDFAGIGDDLEMGGDIFTLQCDGQLHVFAGS